MSIGKKKEILLVEDDELFLQAMQDFLTDKYRIITAESAEKAFEILQQKTPDLLLLDITLPGVDGTEALKRIRKEWPEVPVIMMTAIDRISKVVECIKLGAADYLAKPVIAEELCSCVVRALESSDMKRELEQFRKLQLAANKEYRLRGTSPAIERIRREMQTVAKSDLPVLIQGPTGVGKELVAREIHGSSSRASGPFVAINCSAIPKDLFESEFFGHKKGAYTGAHVSEIGKFQLADGGTLLLDEISELPSDAQAKLLRVLEEHEFYPVGSNELTRVDVRLVASTNRNLAEHVRKNMFREDLYYRLNVYSISIPPLSDRPEDILVLTEYYLQQFNAKFGKQFTEISSGAKEVLLRHHWSGNVRELRNLLERVTLSETGPVLTKESLYFIDSTALREITESGFKLPESGVDLEKVEKELILQALRLAKGNKAKAAKLLSLSAPTFYYRLEKYGLG